MNKEATTSEQQMDFPSKVLRWAISLPGALVLFVLALISVVGRLKDISFSSLGAILWLCVLALYIGGILGSRWATEDDKSSSTNSGS